MLVLRCFPILGGLFLAAGCTISQTQHEANARFFEHLIPGARIGAPAAAVASRYHLPLAAYVGYGDSAATPREGIRGLFLSIEPAPSQGEKPSADAVISSISLTIQHSSMAQGLVGDLNREYGAPMRYCYVRGDEVSFDLQYWSQESEHGVLASRRAGVAAPITFTMPAVEPDSVRSAPGACAG